MNYADLQNVFDELIKKIPENPDGNNSFTFDSTNLPVLPPYIEINELYIKKSEHTYNESCKFDLLYFNSRKETYKILSLIILSAVFHPEPKEIQIKLNNPESDISTLIIQFTHPELDNLPSGYHTKPFAFEYYPAILSKHPFDSCVNPENLPCFSLSNLEKLVYTEEEWKNRDVVRLFGKDKGMVLFAELLLNTALPQSETDEYQLEGEGGFRGVGINSAEVTLLLPGHVFWSDEYLNVEGNTTKD